MMHRAQYDSRLKEQYPVYNPSDGRIHNQQKQYPHPRQAHALFFVKTSIQFLKAPAKFFYR